MPERENIVNTSVDIIASCGGCAAKLPQGLLRSVLGGLPVSRDPDLLVGFDACDDAAVYSVSRDLAVIQTVDFFPAMLGDAYTFGLIAAANALSDVYAMGGRVALALNIVCFPRGSDPARLEDILRGGAEQVMAAGGILCGGHSIYDDTVKYGLCVTGLIDPRDIWRNNTCAAGDALILTKPLGTGIIMTAHSAGKAPDNAFEAAVNSMRALNKKAAETARGFDIHACTDVTGFGLLGHLNEMLNAGRAFRIDAAGVRSLPHALELADGGYITGGGQKNREFLQGRVRFGGVDSRTQELLFDPQTSGGLIFSVPVAQKNALLESLASNGVGAFEIGEVFESETSEIVLI